MKIVGVIPARYQSSRFPGKPLADICGKPMIWWVYQQAKKVPGLTEVWVATEDGRIVEACRRYGLDVELTSDRHQTGTDRLCEVAQRKAADFYVNIQGDEPMIEPEVIQSVIDYFKTHQDSQTINTMTAISSQKDISSNTVVKVVANESGRLLYLSRAPVPYPKNGQEITYYRHMGLYGMTREALQFYQEQPRGKIERTEDIEMFRFLEHGRPISVLEVMSQTIAVDRPEDLEKVKERMRNK